MGVAPAGRVRSPAGARGGSPGGWRRRGGSAGSLRTLRTIGGSDLRSSPMSTPALSDRDRAVLDFEREWTGRRGGKGRAIQAVFGFSAARYYQLLTSLV